jgi:hypothetical protein
LLQEAVAMINSDNFKGLIQRLAILDYIDSKIGNHFTSKIDIQPTPHTTRIADNRRTLNEADKVFSLRYNL